MQVGGYAPVGYNIADKKLVIDPESAPLVQMLFERYHALGCVSALKRELDREGITSRVLRHLCWRTDIPCIGHRHSIANMIVSITNRLDVPVL